MTQARDQQLVPHGRQSRLALVVTLMLGLLVSLLHCASCELSFVKNPTTVVVMNADQGTPPDTPEQQLPCHSGHCLSHATAQSASIVATPADLAPQALAFGQDHSPVAHAGLPLFKPPRA
jgi:hypothetical protein